MESCLYEGVVTHARAQPVTHRFSYRLAMYFLDLAEVPMLLRQGLVSRWRFSLGTFWRGDHLGDARLPLADSVRDWIEQQTGLRVPGPIRLLTQLRTWGYYFSPLNLFYCYDQDGHTLRSVVAEVQNTPWLQRYGYVLWEGNQISAGDEWVYRHPKSFHVSPFMDMKMEYHWRLRPPGPELSVAIDNRVGEKSLFQASLLLQKKTWTLRQQRMLQLRYPCLPAKISAAIYWQAFQLWRKKCPFYPHPRQPTSSPRLQRTVSPAVGRPLCSVSSVAG